jgi:Putative binding domain, N-terminal
MRKISIFNRHWFPAFFFCFFSIVMIFLISGCGGGDDDNWSLGLSETGSASFAIAWHDTPVIQPLEDTLITPAIDCEAAGVSTITCEIYDESNTYLTFQVFACSAGQGMINNVPVGTNRELVILGEDGDGNILYYGKTTGITVTAGQINDAGTIDTHPFFVSDLLSPADGSEIVIDKFSLNWTRVETAYEYRIQVSEDINFASTIINDTTSDTSYTPSGLLESTTYYWKVYARDIHATQSVESAVWSFTVGPCNHSISPTIRPFGSGGGAGSISVTSSASGCSWIATEGVGWINITSGSSGSGDGTVTYSVSPNTSSNSRSATITAAGQSHMVTQEGIPCSYSISPTIKSFESGGGTSSISVTSLVDDCSWTATEGVGWINITSGSSGSGNGTVTYSVSPNTSSNSRSATITVAGRSHTVTQAGIFCTYSISPTIQSFGFGGGIGSISVISSVNDCSWIATEGVGWINITSGSSGSGNGTVNYSVSPNTLSIPRFSVITVAGKSHTVIQDAGEFNH